MATLHANSSNQAIDRIINFFPEERHAQLHMDLSLNLRAFVSQRLVSKKGGGRCAAIEILLNSPLVADLILKGETNMIKEAMAKSVELGMQTFDQALFNLCEEGRITEEDALRNADSINELRLKFKLHSKDSKVRDATDRIAHLSLHEEEPEEEEGEAANTSGAVPPATAAQASKPATAPKPAG